MAQSDMRFSFRVRLGEHEVEISGVQEEVLETVKELPNLLAYVSEAFGSGGPPVSVEVTSTSTEDGSVETKTVEEKSMKSMEKFPSIKPTDKCSEAILRLLQTEWGKWRPRTFSELQEALKVNAINYPSSTLSGVLVWLAKTKRVRRWKTDKGYVYILLEEDNE
ncbi:MAG: hypothetical protein U9O89_00170 [Thermoproteota archaeon]|nr:hypothetical protein [Thermoproteota archaeon]